ncbi:hypothetical protein Q7P35_003425 [Cladosporium inversicolor]
MQQYNRLSADVPHLLLLARARLTPREGQRERVSQTINRRQTARANSWRVRVVATPEGTEIEVRGNTAAGGSGVASRPASQAEVGARSRRACVKKRRSTPSGTNRDSNTRAVCGMRAQWRDTKCGVQRWACDNSSSNNNNNNNDYDNGTDSRAQELVKEETDKARRSIYSKGPEKSRIDDRLRKTTKTRDERVLSGGGELQLEALDGRPEHSVKPNTIIPLVIRTSSLCPSLHRPHGSVYVSRGVAAVATLQWRDLLNSLRHRD